MSKVNIIRAWKDEVFRLSLNAEQRALVPANPAGAIELQDAELDGVSGGKPRPTITGSTGTCGDIFTK
jgi:mersacidin/lichenicidin family type 2 lantibiotic